MEKKIVHEEDGLTTVAVALGSALGKLAQKVGLGEPGTSAPTLAQQKSAASKAPRKKTVRHKKPATKKTTAKQPGLKKANRPAKKK